MNINTTSPKPTTNHRYPNTIIDVLIKVRQEWELVAEGKSLLNHEGRVGLLLFDIVTKLNISTEDQRYLLGSSLFDEVTDFITRQCE
ncbi:MAG: hypothetical protein KF758_19155 [Anaerolineales bacterium]|nr:hypothetical protein [Anaerolineales bacterium]